MLQHGATVDELINGYLQLEKLAELHGRLANFVIPLSVWLHFPPSPVHRVISSYLSAGEAVHYALHYISNLVTIGNRAQEQPLNGVVASSNQKIRPVLRLPDVFDLYHLSNQTAPLLASHAVVGRPVIITIY